MFLKWLQGGDGPLEKRVEGMLVHWVTTNKAIGRVTLGYQRDAFEIAVIPEEEDMEDEVLVYLMVPFFVDKLLHALPGQGSASLMDSISAKLHDWNRRVAPTVGEIGMSDELELSEFELVLRRTKRGLPYLDQPAIHRDPITDARSLHYPDAQHPDDFNAQAASYFLGLHLIDYAAAQLPEEFSLVLREFLSHQRTFFLMEGAGANSAVGEGTVPKRILSKIFDGEIPRYRTG